MHDDERYLLGASQATGEIVPQADMAESHLAYLKRKWAECGWFDPATGRMTVKGLAAKGGRVRKPVETVPIEPPVEIQAAVEILPIPPAFDGDTTIELIPHASDEEPEIVPL